MSALSSTNGTALLSKLGVTIQKPRFGVFPFTESLTPHAELFTGPEEMTHTWSPVTLGAVEGTDLCGRPAGLAHSVARQWLAETMLCECGWMAFAKKTCA